MKSPTINSTVAQAFYSDFPTGDRFKIFQELMRFRIREILLVSSQYNLFLLEEEGRMYEFLRNKYYQLNLSHTPEIVRVANTKEALELLREKNRFDLVITTAHNADLTVTKFALKVKEINKDLPVVHLVFDTNEFNPRLSSSSQNPFDSIFTWNGDFRIIISIIKLIEDKKNVAHDVELAGVQVILLVEDNIRFYSIYLPLLYSELLLQSQNLIEQGINIHQKFLRMRARPKILLASNFEEACYYFDHYEEHILGVISDVNYMRGGNRDEEAGLHLAQYIKSHKYDIPILLQSHDASNEKKAHKAGASFLNKDSRDLLDRIRQFAFENLGFGDFIFKTGNGKEMGVAKGLLSLHDMLKKVPIESLMYHAKRNHFSNWLKARREFWLAYKLRPRKVSDYDTPEDLRTDLVSSLELYITMQQRGILVDFNIKSFDHEYGFARIGTGSIGGKARGLSFLNLLLSTNALHLKFNNVEIKVPSSIVLGTNVFETFMHDNKLNNKALKEQSDEVLAKLFLKADFPKDIAKQLSAFLKITKHPIAVRSSSLLEDSQYFPFAGVYNTIMLANNQKNIKVRLKRLIEAIKLVYASTYSKRAQNYMRYTSFRLEEERMGIVIQSLVGNKHNNRFYPDISGVAKSYNYYVVPPQKSDDGLVSVALGLGITVVEGGNSLSFCPIYPKQIPQFASIEQTLQNNQVDFYAIDISEDSMTKTDDVQSFPISAAEKDGSLFYSASTYSPDNNAIYDGISRPGQRIITLAPILKQEIIPLPQIISSILKLGKEGMGSDVEIEFALRFSNDKKKPHEFCLLQMRPVNNEDDDIRIDFTPQIKSKSVCYSDQVLGNGHIEDIRDIVIVDKETFQRAKTRLIADEIRHYNRQLHIAKKPYLLVTLGRLGSADSWLGIPVHWEQIAGAKVIIESGIKEMAIEPSQASHFFQNISSFKIAYFTINPQHAEHFLNWTWLKRQKVASALEFVKHIELPTPLQVKINGRKNTGIITFE